MIDQKRFDELVAGHRVPGAVLAVAVGDELHELATGVLNISTGVPTTTDSLFQLASISKPYTATMVLRLVERGLVGLDTRVAEVLPDFRVADPEVSERVTLRHLLAHTSGIAGDFFHDTGSADDALARYVSDCADLGQDTPLGATFSYSNTGYNILGRVIEAVTGTSWEQALADLVTRPLGLTHTWALPGELLGFRAATAHRLPPGSSAPELASAWEACPRGENPCGGIWASGADVIAFARAHLTDPALAVMRERQVEVPSPVVDHWGLGWMLFEWDGLEVFGHGGDNVGQSCRLYVVPERRFAAVLLTNTDTSAALVEDVIRELLAEHCGIRKPERLSPPEVPVVLADPARHVGSYGRVGSRVDISAVDGGLRLRFAGEGLMAEFVEPFEVPLHPLSERLFVGREGEDGPWMPFVVEDGYVHFGVRAYVRAPA